MQARALFDRVVGMWPDDVDISAREPTPSGGWWFPELGRIRGEIEGSIDHSLDHWACVGSDAFYWAVTRQANLLYESGGRRISPSSVSLSFFDHAMRTLLQAEGWEAEAVAYEPLNGGEHAV
jgi:hypothetical protein